MTLGKLFVCVAFATILSCKNSEKIPDDIIKQDDMAFYIAEFQLLENRIKNVRFRGFDSTRIANLYLIQKELEKKGYDTVKYRKSFEFYSSKPELFSQIYDEAIILLEQKKDEEKPSNNSDI